jgi:protein TonB
MTSQALQRSFNLAAAIAIVWGGIWLLVGPLFLYGALHRRAGDLGFGSTGNLRLFSLLVVAYAFVSASALYLSGWGIWWRRRWSRLLFLVALPVCFGGIMAGWLSRNATLLTALLWAPLWMFMASGRNWRTAMENTASPASDVPPQAGNWLGWIVAAFAITFLGIAAVFSRLGSSGAVLTVLGCSALLSTALLLSGWRPWKRLLGIILVGAALCTLVAVFALGFARLSALPPLSRIPFLASSGLLYMASVGTSLETLVMVAVESAIPAAALLLLFGIPFAAAPARAMPRGAVGSLGAHRMPVLASVLAIALVVPLLVEWQFARESSPSGPTAAAIAPLAKAPPPPPPPRSTEPPAPRVIPEGPIGSGTGTRIATVPAPGPSSEPTRVASTSLKIAKRVAPQFPHDSGKSGVVIVEIVIDRDGQVISARTLHGDREFAQAAISAVKEWRFEPYTVGGEATRVKTSLTFAFKAQ